MTEILLSICIPTYDRPKKLFSLLKDILSFQSDKIEVIIGDDNPPSTRTQDVINVFSDKRIRYFHNKKNLGLELNLIKIFKLARGKFISYIADDDYIEVKTLPWLLEIISEKSNITQFCCAIGDKSSGKTEIYYEFGEGLLKRGLESILKLLFYYGHSSGILLRKDVLDLDKAINCCGKYTLAHYLVAQAMFLGDTLCTSRIFVNIGPSASQRSSVYKDKKYWHPLSGLYLTQFKIKVVNELFRGKTKKLFLDKQKQSLYSYLFRSLIFETKNFFNSLKNLIQGISIIINIREVSTSLIFWINLIIEIVIRLIEQSKFKNDSFIIFSHTIFKNLRKFCKRDLQISL